MEEDKKCIDFYRNGIANKQLFCYRSEDNPSQFKTGSLYNYLNFFPSSDFPQTAVVLIYSFVTGQVFC